MKVESGRIRFESRDDLPPTAISLGGTEWNQTGSWKFLEPYYEDLTPPCTNACIADMDVVAMMRAVEAGDWDAAARSTLASNPFPAVTGRLCSRPCEQPCNRKAFGGGITVRAVERLVGDHKLEADVRPDLPPMDRPRVHVLGSGPAGLAAAVALRRLGHPVTVHERDEEEGGVLRYGIPGYRLPVEIVRKEVEWTRRLGVEFQTSSKLSGEDVLALGPVILCTAPRRSRGLGIAGEGLPGVLDGGAMIAALRRGDPLLAGSVAAVVGAGPLAVDCARSLVRLSNRVLVFHAGTARDFGAAREDAAQAEEEGVEFVHGARPLAVAGARGRLFLTVAHAANGEPSANSSLVVDLVVDASEGEPGADSLPPGVRTERGRIVVDEAGWTGAACLFAVPRPDGLGGAEVVEAIRAGRRAAESLHARLGGPRGDGEAAGPGASKTVAKFKDLNVGWFTRRPGPSSRVLPLEARRSSFEGIEAPLAPSEARDEAVRCFKCGTCVECDVCYELCPDVAIRKRPEGGYEVDLAHCKGCGVCAEECPRCAIHLRKSR